MHNVVYMTVHILALIFFLISDGYLFTRW